MKLPNLDFHVAGIIASVDGSSKSRDCHRTNVLDGHLQELSYSFAHMLPQHQRSISAAGESTAGEHSFKSRHGVAGQNTSETGAVARTWLRSRRRSRGLTAVMVSFTKPSSTSLSSTFTALYGRLACLSLGPRLQGKQVGSLSGLG